MPGLGRCAAVRSAAAAASTSARCSASRGLSCSAAASHCARSQPLAAAAGPGTVASRRRALNSASVAAGSSGAGGGAAAQAHSSAASTRHAARAGASGLAAQRGCERVGMKAQVILDEAGDEVVIVTVALVAAQLQRLAGADAGLLQQLRQQLTLRQELVGQPLVDQQLRKQRRAACADQLHRVVARPGGRVLAEIARQRLAAPRAAGRRADRCEGGDRAVDVRISERQHQRAVPAHRVAEDSQLTGIAREAAEHRLTQLLEHVVVHAEVARPGRLGRIQVEARAGAELPVVGLAGNAGVARAGVAADQHQAELRGDALRARLDREGLLGAGEAGEIEHHRHRSALRLWRLVDGEAHRRAGYLRVVAVEALQAVETLMLADRFECHVLPRRFRRTCATHYESERAPRSCAHLRRARRSSCHGWLRRATLDTPRCAAVTARRLAGYIFCAPMVSAAPLAPGGALAVGLRRRWPGTAAIPLAAVPGEPRTCERATADGAPTRPTATPCRSGSSRGCRTRAARWWSPAGRNYRYYCRRSRSCR